jgi:uncharacterized DUF497 family protein
MIEATVLRLGNLQFTWDGRKARSNFKYHGVAFTEAATCWLDEFAIETFDEAHSDTEARWLVVGKSDLRRLLTCWYTERKSGDQDVIRLIGARRATAGEKRKYYETKK